MRANYEITLVTVLCRLTQFVEENSYIIGASCGHIPIKVYNHLD
jgi:hypothetical protein